ncbi:hypothetical protein [Streptomyces sp. NPDC001292]|uniref:hypothetical protein n=1 Tax=Streptomyces sp. NPDC001292 TaxID=3364558 RepID=UPI003688F470
MTAAPAHRRRHWSRRPNPPAGLGSVIWPVVVIVPIYAMISTSLTRQDQVLGNALGPPEHPTLENYNTGLHSGFGHLLANTTTVAAAVAIVLVLCVPLAHVAVRTRSFWSGAAFRMFLPGIAIPAQAVVVPLDLVIAKLNLYDRPLAVRVGGWESGGEGGGAPAGVRAEPQGRGLSTHRESPAGGRSGNEKTPPPDEPGTGFPSSAGQALHLHLPAGSGASFLGPPTHCSRA